MEETSPFGCMEPEVEEEIAWDSECPITAVEMQICVKVRQKST